MMKIVSEIDVADCDGGGSQWVIHEENSDPSTGYYYDTEEEAEEAYNQLTEDERY